MCKHTILKTTVQGNQIFYFEITYADAYFGHIRLKDENGAVYRCFFKPFHLEFRKISNFLEVYKMANCFNEVPNVEYFCFHCQALIFSRDNLSDLDYLFKLGTMNGIVKYLEAIGFENKNV